MASEPLVAVDFDTVRMRMQLSLQQLYLQDRHLMEHGVGERSISHRLAVHLESSFRSWHVDCEYNRQGSTSKLADKGNNSKRPDIIVHCRGENGPNLLAIEVKKAMAINAADRIKVQRYIKDLKYQWAVCVGIDRQSACCEWHSEGIGSENLDSLVWTEVKEIGYGH